MARILKPRSGNTLQNNQFTGVDGELVADMETKELVLHDGIKEGGFRIPNKDSIILNHSGLEGRGDAESHPADAIDWSNYGLTAEEIALRVQNGPSGGGLDMVAGLKGLTPSAELYQQVKGYYVGTSAGGGVFYFDPDLSSEHHNGGSIIAQGALEFWDGSSSSLESFLNWSETGTGCYIRIIDQDKVSAEDFGLTVGVNAAIPISAAAFNHKFVDVTDCRLSSEVLIKNPTTLEFKGSVTFEQTSQSSRFLNITSSNVTIINPDFLLESIGDNKIGGIFAIGPTGDMLTNINIYSASFKNLGRYGIYLLRVKGANINSSTMENCNANDGSNGILSVAESEDVKVNGATLTNWVNGKGLAFSLSKDCYARSITTKSNSKAAQSGIYTSLSKSVYISDFIIDVDMDQPAMKISTGSNLCFISNGYIKNIGTSTASHAIFLQGADSCTLSKIILSSKHIPVSMAAGENLGPIGVKFNKLIDCDIQLIDQTSSIIQIQSMIGRTANGNEFVRCKIYSNNNQAGSGVTLNGSNTTFRDCKILAGFGVGISFVGNAGFEGLYVYNSHIESLSTGISFGASKGEIVNTKIIATDPNAYAFSTFEASKDIVIKHSELRGGKGSLVPGGDHLYNLKVTYSDLSDSAPYSDNFYRRFCIGMSDNLT